MEMCDDRTLSTRRVSLQPLPSFRSQTVFNFRPQISSMSLPPILRDNTSLLNASSSPRGVSSRRLHRHRVPASPVVMPTSSGARKSQDLTNGGLPSRSPTSVGEFSSSKTLTPDKRPPFLSERQMSVLGLSQASSGAQKRGRTKSRMTTGAKMSGSTTDLSSNISSSNPKLTRVLSDNKIADIHRHRNLSDSNLAGMRGDQLSRSLNRQRSRPAGNLTSRTAQPCKEAEKEVAEDSGDDDEEEKEERIIQWLLGVEDADAETEQLVVEEPPSQTDTAIHVVYQGD